MAHPKGSAGGGARAAGGSVDMENRKGTIPGRYYTDGQARQTMSFAELKAAVMEKVGSKADLLDAALISGVVRIGKNGLEVGRVPTSPRDFDKMYRRIVGVRPEARGRVARPGMVNGIDIHRDFRPWAVFGLNPKTATRADVESAYRRVARQVHPDLGGRRRDFERVKTMRDSLMSAFPPVGGSKPKRSSKAKARTATTIGGRYLLGGA